MNTETTSSDILVNAIKDSEILALKYCLKLMKNYPADMVIKSLEDYIKELENE